MLLNASSFTSPRALLGLMVAKQTKQTFVVPGEVNYYTAVALTDAVPLSRQTFSEMYGYTDDEAGDGSTETQDRFVVKAMIIGDQIGDPLDAAENPHHMLPIPCAATSPDTTEDDMSKIMMYTTFITTESFAISNDLTIRINDRIIVGLTIGPDGYQELGRGTIEGFVTRGAELAEQDLAGCTTPLAMTFANSGEVRQRQTARTTSARPRSSSGTTTGPNPPLEGTGLGAAPYEEGTIPMIGSWTAHIDPPPSTKDDYTFSSGRCPGGLTGYYSTLPRYNTTFTKYNESDITSVFETAGAEYPLYVRLTAYVYLWKEQPPESGVFSFPNNNPAGLQSDGSQQSGIPVADVDFHTCFRDASTYRGFLGWHTVDQGFAAYLKSINARFQSGYWRGEDRRPPTDTAENFATQAADNYFQGYNIIATDTELASLKTDGSFTRNGTTYNRNYSATKSSFISKYNDFKAAYPSLFTTT